MYRITCEKEFGNNDKRQQNNGYIRDNTVHTVIRKTSRNVDHSQYFIMSFLLAFSSGWLVKVETNEEGATRVDRDTVILFIESTILGFNKAIPIIAENETTIALCIFISLFHFIQSQSVMY